MSTGTGGSLTARSYELRCVDCDFARTFEGDVFEVLDVVDAHQDEHEIDGHEHFVEFECEEARATRPDAT